MKRILLAKSKSLFSFLNMGIFIATLLLTVLSSSVATAQCTHTIRLTDTYGDGWNGGTVTVTVGGVAVLTNITLSTGYGPLDYTFSASTGSTINVTRTAAGSYSYEMRISVLGGTGTTLIATQEPVASPGTNTTGVCSGGGSGCTNTSFYPSTAFTAPAAGAGAYTITTCNYQSEYNQMNSATAGNTFTSTGSIAGTYITVRSGTYNGTVVATGTTPLNWTAAAGGTYFIHYNTNSSCGTASSCMTTTITNTTPAALPGENCGNAQNLASLTSPYSATTVGYANDISTCRTGFPDRIFYISVPNGSTLSIGESTNGYDEYEYVGYGATCPGTTTINCWDNDALSQTVWTNTTGSTQTVWYVQDGYSDSGTFTLQWSVTAAFDPCSSITNITGCGVSTSATIAAGTGAYNPPATTCGFSTPGQEKIYTFTPTVSGLYQIAQTASFTYTDYFFKTAAGGCSGTGWTCIGDLNGLGTTVSSSFNLTAGTQYYIMLDPESSTGGNVTFSIVCPPPPANDNCANAIDISSLPYTSAIISNGTATDDVPSSICDGPYKNIWWKVTGICGTMTAITCTGGTNIDNEMAVFTGSCGSMTQVVCNDDNGAGCTSNYAGVSWQGTAGVVYYISVGTYYVSGATGNLQLNVTAVADAPPSISSATAGASSVCPGSTTTLTANGVGGAGALVTWWTGAGGTGSNLGTGTSYPGAGPGTYYARVTGNCTPAAEAMVSVGMLSVPAISSVTAGTNPVCGSSTTTLTANGVSGDGYTVTWWTGSGGTGTNLGTGTSLPNVGSGTYYARVTGTCSPATEASINISALTEVNYYSDSDGDTYGFGSATPACVQPPNTVTNAADCNDAVFAINPGATEVCNLGIDDDCDGNADDADSNVTGQGTYYSDTDADTYGVGAPILACLQGANADNADDCDDTENAINPGASETCNDLDDDCDTNIDDGLPLFTYYQDADNDLRGNPNVSVMDCGAPAGYVAEPTDCDDANYKRCPNPWGTTTLNFTNNSALLDWEVSPCAIGFVVEYRPITVPPTTTWTIITLNETTTPYELTGLPEGTEFQWRVKNICFDTITTNSGYATPMQVFNTLYRVYPDNDGDGFGELGAASSFIATYPQAGYSLNDADCDDEVATTHPGAEELCNGIDDDCDIIVEAEVLWYQDLDGDGKGNPNVFLSSCEPPMGYVANNADCADNSTSPCPKPFAMTTTDITDVSAKVSWENLPCATKYRLEYRRTNPTAPTWTVVYPTTQSYNITGLVPGGGKTYQWRVATVCSPEGTSAESGYAAPIQAFTTKYKVYTDADIDSYGDSAGSPSYVTSMPQPGYSVNNTDCNDDFDYMHPGAAEVCNGMDDDCDTVIDEGTNWYQDADEDGLGNAAAAQVSCSQPSGYVVNNMDCDDNNNSAVCSTPSNVMTGTIGATFAVINWSAVSCASGYNLLYRVLNPLGPFSQVFNTTGTTMTFSGLTPNTTYQFRIRSKCPAPNPAATSPWTYYTFTTILPQGLSEAGNTETITLEPESIDFDVYPNPGNGIFNIRLSSEMEEIVFISVLDGVGREVFTTQWALSEGLTIDQLDLSHLSGGVYHVNIQQGDMMQTKKIVIVK
jgi:hypothetical protein